VLSLKAEKEPSESLAFVGADDCGHERGVSCECRLVEARKRSCCSFEEWKGQPDYAWLLCLAFKGW